VFWLVAAACAAANAGIHAYLAPMHLDEEPYIGVLFVIGTILLVITVAGLLWARTRRAAWQLGAAVSLGMCASYVASRTIGLPYGYHESWSDPFGTTCLLLEAAYVLAYVMAYLRPVVSNDVAVRPDSSKVP